MVQIHDYDYCPYNSSNTTNYTDCTEPPDDPTYIYGPNEHCVFETETYYTNPNSTANKFYWKTEGALVEATNPTLYAETDVTVHKYSPGFILKVQAFNSCGPSNWYSEQFNITDCGGTPKSLTDTSNILKSNYNASISYADKSMNLDIKNVKESFSIYPNPATTKLNISLKLENNKGYMKIYNLKGQKLREQIITDNFIQIDIDDLQPGVYLLKISNRKHILTKKFKVIR